MNLKNLKNSTGFIAAVAGLLFALASVGLEILTENPQAVNSISVWHFSLIWLLAGVLAYCVLYIVRPLRSGKVRERAIPFSISVVLAAVLALVRLYPMLAGLMQCFGESGC